MEESKEKEQDIFFSSEENKLFCEKYMEWVEEGEGCRHKSDYCQFRKQCLIYLKEKFKDF